MPQHKDAKHRRICLSKIRPWLQSGGKKRPQCGQGVFMEKLLAELERRGAPLLVEVVGKKEETGGDS